MPNDSFSASGSSRDSTLMVYDPVTKTWKAQSTSNTSSSGTSVKSTSNGQSNVQGSGSSESEPSQTNTKKEADQEQLKQRFSSLTGDLEVVISDTVLSLAINDTVYLDGFGSSLSGLYLITGRDISLNESNGLRLSLHVSKNGFSDGVPSGSSNSGRPQQISK